MIGKSNADAMTVLIKHVLKSKDSADATIPDMIRDMTVRCVRIPSKASKTFGQQFNPGMHLPSC